MKKISLVLAALATIAVAAPSVASAESFGFRVGSDRDYSRDYYRDRDNFRGARAEYYGHDRGLHRGWYKHGGDRTVIIQRRHHWDD
jgi:Ni/Co efflux regulator RcnB